MAELGLNPAHSRDYKREIERMRQTEKKTRERGSGWGGEGGRERKRTLSKLR